MRKARVGAAFAALLISSAGMTGIAQADPAPERRPVPVPDGVHVVEPGDTLSGLFGPWWGYVCITNVAKGTIAHCDLIHPGQRLDSSVTLEEMAVIDAWVAALPPPPEPVVVEVRHRQRSAPVASEPQSAPQASGGPSNGWAIPEAIVMCESGGNYSAENPTSSASGAYQIIDGTWGGYGGYSHASDAPPSVQDERAAQIYAGGAGRGHWVC